MNKVGSSHLRATIVKLHTAPVASCTRARGTDDCRKVEGMESRISFGYAAVVIALSVGKLSQ